MILSRMDYNTNHGTRSTDETLFCTYPNRTEKPSSASLDIRYSTHDATIVSW